MKVYFVYILKCSDNTYYTGVTSNLNQRIIEHKTGKHIDSYTFKRRPIELVFYAEFTDINLAIITEKQIKKWSKAKKEALINNDFEKLPNLAKKRFNKNA
jgi:putative endonuclease